MGGCVGGGEVSMKRAILRPFHLVVRTKIQKSAPLMELFSEINMNSLENLAMNIAIKRDVRNPVNNT